MRNGGRNIWINLTVIAPLLKKLMHQLCKNTNQKHKIRYCKKAKEH